MAKYRCLTDTFIAPTLLKAETVFTIDDDFEPGPHLYPLDAAANAAFDKYYEAKPGRNLQPVEDLPLTMTPVIETTPLPAEDPGMSLAEATHARAVPGPTEGGRTGLDKPKSEK